MKVAVTGASGFIGNRIVEVFHLAGQHQPIAVVHSNSSLALPARFDLAWRVCDHLSVEELCEAFEECDVVVHAAFGSPLKAVSEAVYRAADKARVRRLIVLSSASVYNQNPAPGITEESPLPANPATAYNAAKIVADLAIRRLRSNCKTEAVFLMPGIVYGPRSQWVDRVVKQAAAGTAYLIDGGAGICNAVYVDNVVEAVRLAMDAKDVDGHHLFVSDRELVTWADFYRPLVAATGRSLEDVHHICRPQDVRETAQQRFRSWLAEVSETKLVKDLKPRVPNGLIRVYKGLLAMTLNPGKAPNAFAVESNHAPQLSQDLTLLQQCEYKLPNAKAERLLGYRPIVSFDEGMRRSVAWLQFLGSAALTSSDPPHV